MVNNIMNKAKNIFYGALAAATLFCASPNEAYAKDKDKKLSNVFYFESREDLNGNGQYESNEYFGVQKFGGIINPVKVDNDKDLYLFVKNRKDKTTVVMAKSSGRKNKKILENISTNNEEFIFETLNEGKGNYGIAIDGKGLGMKIGKVVRE